MKIEKVKEPEGKDVWQCPRCHQDFCEDCVDKHNVNFEVADEPEGYNQRTIQWKDLLVCPWCYNQLIDVAEKKEVKQ